MKLTDRFVQALEYSFYLHKDQTRKVTNVPYMSHLLSVSALVIENNGTEDEAIAALLHDAVEDQGGLKILEEIKSKFGQNIGCIVEECSDSFTAKDEEKLDWKQRKIAYISKVEKMSKSALLVNYADKIHNLRSILRDHRLLGKDIWTVFKSSKLDMIWLYRSLIAEYRKHESHVLVDELEELVNQIEKLDTK